MRRHAPGLAAVALLLAFAVGLVAPCLCGLRPSPARPAHGCCAPEAGLRAATPACCPCLLDAPRTPAAALAESRAVLGAPALPAPPLLAPSVPSVAAFVVTTPAGPSPPPTILRV